jgi:hypothetical protein
MADEKKPGLLGNVKQRVAAQADALKAGAAASFRDKAAEIREAIGPQKTEPVKQPERPFGREEGGEDIKHVVWTGHTVKTPEGQAYFGAVGLTQHGYYRTAEVQVYGSDEAWRWQEQRHTIRDDAISSAETASANRLNPAEWKEPDGGAARLYGMAELPEHVKAQADNVVAETGASKMPVKDMDAPKATDWKDTAAMDAARQQQRENALQEKSPAPTVQPDKG